MAENNLVKSRSVSLKEKRICLSRGYEVHDTFLGGGAVGRVFLGEALPERIATNNKLKLIRQRDQPLQVAIKIIYADVGSVLVGKLAKYIPNEITNMGKNFGNSNIVMLLDVFVACKRIFLVLEYAAKGSLKDLYASYIATNADTPYMSEKEARYYFREIMCGIQQLHRHHVAHRDLKLDNVLITGDGQVKLGDFGFAITLPCWDVNRENLVEMFRDMVNTTLCGTPCFMAPEVLRASCGYNAVYADIWSMGIVLYVLVNGHYPFPGKTVKTVLEQYEKRQGRLLFRKDLSQECKDLISDLLNDSPSLRPSTQVVMNCPWMSCACEEPKGLKAKLISREDIDRVQKDKEYEFQAKFVRNYLLQRSKLLNETRRALASKKKLPVKILSEFGIRVSLPRQDTEGQLVEEVWRVDVNLPDSDKVVASDIADTLDPACGLGLNCEWASSDAELTVGIPSVKRIVLDLPLIAKWLDLRTRNDPPSTEIEKCVQLCNTVDLDVGRSWPLEEKIPRPNHQWVEVSPFRRSRSSLFSKYSSDGVRRELGRVLNNGKPTDVLVVCFPDEAEMQTSLDAKYLQASSPIEDGSWLKKSSNRLSSFLLTNNRLPHGSLSGEARTFEVKRPACVPVLDVSRVRSKNSGRDSKNSTPRLDQVDGIHGSVPNTDTRSGSRFDRRWRSLPFAAKSLIPMHSSRKIWEDYKRKKAKDEMRRRTLPACAFYKTKGTTSKPFPKALVEKLDVMKILERPDRGDTKIPKPRCVRTLRAVLLQNKKLLQKSSKNDDQSPSEKTTKKRKAKRGKVFSWLQSKLSPKSSPRSQDSRGSSPRSTDHGVSLSPVKRKKTGSKKFRENADVTYDKSNQKTKNEKYNRKKSSHVTSSTLRHGKSQASCKKELAGQEKRLEKNVVCGQRKQDASQIAKVRILDQDTQVKKIGESEKIREEEHCCKTTERQRVGGSTCESDKGSQSSKTRRRSSWMSFASGNDASGNGAARDDSFFRESAFAQFKASLAELSCSNISGRTVTIGELSPSELSDAKRSQESTEKNFINCFSGFTDLNETETAEKCSQSTAQPRSLSRIQASMLNFTNSGKNPAEGDSRDELFFSESAFLEYKNDLEKLSQQSGTSAGNCMTTKIHKEDVLQLFSIYCDREQESVPQPHFTTSTSTCSDAQKSLTWVVEKDTTLDDKGNKIFQDEMTSDKVTPDDCSSATYFIPEQRLEKLKDLNSSTGCITTHETNTEDLFHKLSSSQISLKKAAHMKLEKNPSSLQAERDSFNEKRCVMIDENNRKCIDGLFVNEILTKNESIDLPLLVDKKQNAPHIMQDKFCDQKKRFDDMIVAADQKVKNFLQNDQVCAEKDKVISIKSETNLSCFSVLESLVPKWLEGSTQGVEMFVEKELTHNNLPQIGETSTALTWTKQDGNTSQALTPSRTTEFTFDSSITHNIATQPEFSGKGKIDKHSYECFSREYNKSLDVAKWIATEMLEENQPLDQVLIEKVAETAGQSIDRQPTKSSNRKAPDMEQIKRETSVQSIHNQNQYQNNVQSIKPSTNITFSDHNSSQLGMTCMTETSQSTRRSGYSKLSVSNLSPTTSSPVSRTFSKLSLDVQEEEDANAPFAQEQNFSKISAESLVSKTLEHSSVPTYQLCNGSIVENKAEEINYFEGNSTSQQLDKSSKTCRRVTYNEANVFSTSASVLISNEATHQKNASTERSCVQTDVKNKNDENASDLRNDVKIPSPFMQLPVHQFVDIAAGDLTSDCKALSNVIARDLRWPAENPTAHISKQKSLDEVVTGQDSSPEHIEMNLVSGNELFLFNGSDLMETKEQLNNRGLMAESKYPIHTPIIDAAESEFETPVGFGDNYVNQKFTEGCPPPDAKQQIGKTLSSSPNLIVDTDRTLDERPFDNKSYFKSNFAAEQVTVREESDLQSGRVCKTPTTPLHKVSTTVPCTSFSETNIPILIGFGKSKPTTSDLCLSGAEKNVYQLREKKIEKHVLSHAHTIPSKSEATCCQPVKMSIDKNASKSSSNICTDAILFASESEQKENLNMQVNNGSSTCSFLTPPAFPEQMRFKPAADKKVERKQNLTQPNKLKQLGFTSMNVHTQTLRADQEEEKKRKHEIKKANCTVQTAKTCLHFSNDASSMTEPVITSKSDASQSVHLTPPKKVAIVQTETDLWQTLNGELRIEMKRDDGEVFGRPVTKREQGVQAVSLYSPKQKPVEQLVQLVSSITQTQTETDSVATQITNIKVLSSTASTQAESSFGRGSSAATQTSWNELKDAKAQFCGDVGFQSGKTAELVNINTQTEDIALPDKTADCELRNSLGNNAAAPSSSNSCTEPYLAKISYTKRLNCAYRNLDTFPETKTEQETAKLPPSYEFSQVPKSLPVSAQNILRKEKLNQNDLESKYSFEDRKKTLLIQAVDESSADDNQPWAVFQNVKQVSNDCDHHLNDSRTIETLANTSRNKKHFETRFRNVVSLPVNELRTSRSSIATAGCCGSLDEALTQNTNTSSGHQAAGECRYTGSVKTPGNLEETNSRTDVYATRRHENVDYEYVNRCRRRTTNTADRMDFPKVSSAGSDVTPVSPYIQRTQAKYGETEFLHSTGRTELGVEGLINILLEELRKEQRRRVIRDSKRGAGDRPYPVDKPDTVKETISPLMVGADKTGLSDVESCVFKTDAHDLCEQLHPSGAQISPQHYVRSSKNLLSEYVKVEKGIQFPPEITAENQKQGTEVKAASKLFHAPSSADKYIPNIHVHFPYDININSCPETQQSNIRVKSQNSDHIPIGYRPMRRKRKSSNHCQYCHRVRTDWNPEDLARTETNLNRGDLNQAESKSSRLEPNSQPFDRVSFSSKTTKPNIFPKTNTSLSRHNQIPHQHESIFAPAISKSSVGNPGLDKAVVFVRKMRRMRKLYQMKYGRSAAENSNDVDFSHQRDDIFGTCCRCALDTRFIDDQTDNETISSYTVHSSEIEYVSHARKAAAHKATMMMK